jgi:hypothetical protein
MIHEELSGKIIGMERVLRAREAGEHDTPDLHA